MRRVLEGVDLLVAEVDVALDEVFGEHVALGQEGVVGAQIFKQQTAKITRVFPSYQANAGRLSISALWDLDFWGKYRRATEAARATLLGSEWGRRAVLSSVVASVASSYFDLRALDAELTIAKRTLASRQHSLRLTRVLAQHGSAGGTERDRQPATAAAAGYDPRAIGE